MTAPRTRLVAAGAAALMLTACSKETPFVTDVPSASVKEATVVRIHGYVSIPCHRRALGVPAGIRLVFKTRANALLGKATTGETEFTTRSDGACAQRAAYSITLPRRAAYVARDPIHPYRDVIATLDQLTAAAFRWDFRY
jgi:hypothetical protein